MDEPSVKRILEMLIEEGVDGIVVAASTGEWFSLSNEERVRLFAIASDQVGKRVRLLAGTAAMATRDAVLLTEAARKLGFDGALVLPPPYVLPSERETVAFFAAVAEVGLPLMLYNNPARTQVNLNAHLLRKLVAFDAVVALKDSVKDLGQLGETLRTWKEELAIFTGLESYAVPCLQRGAAGVVAMAPNVMGREAVRLSALVAMERRAELLPLQEKIDRLYEKMYGWGHNPYVVIKEAMRLLGRPGGWPRPPLLPIPDADRAVLRSMLSELGFSPA
jgi:4-hydroxy-tetrahydrodipicolinate synthase